MKPRTDALISLITSFLGQLNEQDLFKLLDLIRNTLDDRDQLLKKRADVRREAFDKIEMGLQKVYRTGKNTMLFRPENITENDELFAPAMGKAMNLPPTKRVTAEIGRLGLNTAPYGVVMMPRRVTAAGGEYILSGSKGRIVLDIFFGLANRCDGVVTLDWDTKIVDIEVVDRLDGSIFYGKQPFGPTILLDLQRIADKYGSDR